jgi:hypothetical protein
MNTNETNLVASRHETDIAGGKTPGRGVVTVGYYTSAEGDFLLVPVLTCFSDEDRAGRRERLDRVFVGPVYRSDEPGFDLLSRADAGFTRLFATLADLPSLPADESRRTKLVLIVGPDKANVEWVAVGVWDGRKVCAIGHAFRADESNVAGWLWRSNIVRVTAYASPETVREELAAAGKSRG